MGTHQSQQTLMSRDDGERARAQLRLLELTLLAVKIGQNNYYLFFSCQK